MHLSITTGLRSAIRANKKWRQNSAMARTWYVGGGERDRKRNDENMRSNNVGVRENKIFITDNVDTDIVECFWRKKMKLFLFVR